MTGAEVQTLKAAEGVSTVSVDNLWNTQHNQWYWSCDLGSVPRYDANGYPYIYFLLETVSGKMALNVDLSQPEILGSAAQQRVALSDYLAQFDAANRRGHGNAKLIAQFKDAFVQLNSNYPAADELSVPLLNGKDRSLLSGLADFTASMSGDFTDAADLDAYLGDKLSRCEVVLEEPSDVEQAWAFVTCSYQTSNSRTVVYAKEVETWDSRPSE